MQLNTIQSSESIPKGEESSVQRRWLTDQIRLEKHASRKLIHCRVASMNGRNGGHVAVEIHAPYDSISAK
jgi:hypothetical protein